MEEIESQISQIQLGNPKNAKNFVYVSAEKAAGSDSEIYIIVELPLLNPAAEDSCKQIALSINSAIKRAYKKPLTEETFEYAISQINEEFGKLVSMGQTHWVNRLNGIIAVKTKDVLTISTSGKVSAFLFRNSELTDISCSSSEQHPLKTFENYASGKISLNDLLILSTSQLFNYIAIDRLKNILVGQQFLAASQTIIQLLKQNAGPEIAFGILLNLQVPTGHAVEEEIDLETYSSENEPKRTWVKNTLAFFQNAFSFNNKRSPNTDLPVNNGSKSSQLIEAGQQKQRMEIQSKFERILSILTLIYEKIIISKNWVKQNFNSRPNFVNVFRKSSEIGKKIFNWQKFKNLSKEKRFFFISACILLVVVIVSINLAWRYRKIEKQRSDLSQSLEKTRNYLADAQASILYNNKIRAIELIQKAENALPSEQAKTEAQKPVYEQALKQISELKEKLEKKLVLETENLGSLSLAENIIKLPKYLATQNNGKVTVSFNKNSGKIEDGAVNLPENTFFNVNLPSNKIAIYKQTAGLVVWDALNQQSGPEFTQNVPKLENFAGLAYYPTNQRVYLGDRLTKQIISYSINQDQFSKPTIALKEIAELSTTISFAIDGNIYLLHENGISKYLAGKKTEFKSPFLFENFSGKGKITTNQSMKNVYILDSNKKIIIISDKTGNIINTITSSQFTNLKDMEIDEKNKTIYVLDADRLLKITLP